MNKPKFICCMSILFCMDDTDADKLRKLDFLLDLLEKGYFLGEYRKDKGEISVFR